MLTSVTLSIHPFENIFNNTKGLQLQNKQVSSRGNSRSNLYLVRAKCAKSCLKNLTCINLPDPSTIFFKSPNLLKGRKPVACSGTHSYQVAAVNHKLSNPNTHTPMASPVRWAQNPFCPSYGLTCVPSPTKDSVPTPVPVKATLFGREVFVDHRAKKG